MWKRLLSFVGLMVMVSFAQESPQPLPISFQGEGTQQTTLFSTAEPWQVEVTSNALVLLYLYDSASGENLGSIQNGQPISNTGTFFIYVNTSGSWQMNLSSLTIAEPALLEPPAEAEPSEGAADASGEPVVSIPSPVGFPLKQFGFGTARFARSVSASLNTQVCESFSSGLEVQNSFIASGGPDLDPYSLDPDGDGYACLYDPLETYTPPMECKDGQIWWNPRFRNRDGVYIEGNCRKP